MNRFVLGLVFGAAGSGIAYAAGANTYWTVGVGLVVACLIWFGEFILDDLL
jgi:hypothetical protein